MEVRSKAATKITLSLTTVLLGLSAVSLLGKDHHFSSDRRSPLMQRTGAAVYTQSCARCHGSDGRAQTAKGRAVGATDLTSNDWSPDTARDTRIVTRGKEEMPAFKTKLKPTEIEAVVTYIRRFKR